jgi:flagellar motor switch protein FliN/FliY
MTAETNAVAAVLSELQEPAPAAERPRPRLESVLDVPVKVSAVLGRRRMAIADLMALEAGSVVELDRRVGEPIDLYINETLIARGELVLIDGALGVAMTEIVRKNEG